ncbi:MAG TPA: hypothetical protein VK541_11325 [Pedobacter sp.]|uniref:hypothetical protein n=1 Tax=Pedobacter sp. TaxID=1411316 RepID=UPI002C77F916|nr:hypothetical protein [Pedobacter sp.]HMI03066.1 hypothetical protein [Pedobacter sp.]
MILGFSQVINGQPTLFIEKIWESIYQMAPERPSQEYLIYQQAYKDKFGKFWDGTGDMWHEPVDPKLHTIRNPRVTKSGDIAAKQWKSGDLIHPAIHNRSPLYFQFAPIMKVISVQAIRIKWYKKQWSVYVDDRQLAVYEVEKLAKNDGFTSLHEFSAYFDTDFAGVIIHWTNLRY